MNRKPNWFKRWYMALSHGAILSDDNWVEDGWIIYKDIYIQVLKGDDGYSVAWTKNLPSHYPIRDMHKLSKNRPPKPLKKGSE